MAWNVVIAGGGFAGFHTARTLERVLPAHSARVRLVNDSNFMLYTPLLPGAAGGTLEPRHVVVPLREQLSCTELHLGTVTGADPEQRHLHVRSPDGDEQRLSYDQLVIALGSVSRTLPIPGLAEHAVGFKTLSEGIALRNHVIRSLEMAEEADDAAQRSAHLTFVFVGAGYAGLEGLAELQDFAADVIEHYPRCRLDGMRWVLVEARERVMPEISPELARFATRELTARGIEIRTATTLEEVSASSARLSDGEVLATRTVIWTAGVRPHPSVARLGLALDADGRVSVDRYLRVRGQRNVWAVGDAAGVPDPARPGQPCPPTAQHAIRQGRRLARNIAAELGSGRARPFRYRTLGVFVDLGRKQAVASTLGLKWRGPFAWFLARSYHLAWMPGLSRKLRLLLDWNVGLLFGRDSAELGQLGHPGRLAEPAEGQTSGGGELEQPATASVGVAGTRTAPPRTPLS
ncbi:MAG TPA: NAD(P)/FAD-dependent oxidoreductase [Solirubrobacteraceae bacterium]|jgi:NADH dehydrogenase|nr:NAD(P)/FAD-dependent oxidoreductase [Solirubrobacteraceae bacterium]